MAPGEAATSTAQGCPVCLTPFADEPACARCRWVLHGPPVLGRVTPEIRRAFDERLAAARRRLDLTAAARAAGHPGHSAPERLARLEALVRHGPPPPGERDAVLRELEHDDTPAVEETRSLPDGVVAEITVRGLRATTVRQGIEDAEATEWGWDELLPDLPRDEDERLFLLAGGVGHRTSATPAVREPDDLGAARTATMLISTLPGWTVPELLLARLEQRLPHARARYLPAAEPQPAPLRHAAGLTAVACGSTPNTDGVQLAGGSPDGSVTVWQLWQPQPVASRVLHDRLVTCVDLAEDGRSVVTGGQDGAVRLWSYAGSGRVRVLTWHDGWVNALRQRGGVVFSLGDDARIHRSVLGDAVIDGGPLTRVGWASATALDATSDARTVVVGGSDGASLWDGTNGSLLGRFCRDHAVTALVLATDDRLLALGCGDGVVRVFDLAGDRAWEVGGHGGAVRQVAFGPGGALATADDTGTVRFRAGDGGCTTVLGAHPDRIRGLAFTADGHLLSAGGDGLVRTWPVPSLDRRHTLGKEGS
ncbi:WD40 repeat domain-containing protein [Streptomyces sp. NPDC001178]